ncbi:MAG: dTMP kinase [Candidatus Thermoplasmatota archaeon]|nr:dTMP kinase [Candidatus Thermoplasmatota archaeon]
MVKGKLITFEGIDASGKTTLAKEVYKKLKKENLAVVLVSEPTNTWLGKAVRRATESNVYPCSEALLFTADHANLVAKIRRWLSEKKIVLCDRYNDSSYAYQGVQLRKILAEKGIDSVEWLKSVQRPLTIVPDLTLLLVIEPELALARIKFRMKSKFERVKFLKQVQELYFEFAAREKRYKKLDATKSVEELAAEGIKEIKKLM